MSLLADPSRRNPFHRRFRRSPDDSDIGNKPEFVNDVAQPTPRDPQGCGDIREAFARELKRRWQAVDRTLTSTIAAQDLALIPPADQVAYFQKWLEALLAHQILGGDGSWVAEYLTAACERARARANRLDPRKAEAAPDA